MNCATSRRSGAGGFTLIEVLVALAIVVFGMSALLGTLTSAADSALYLRDKAFASWIGLNRISELRLAAKRPPVGKSGGELEYAGRKWQFEQEVTQSDIDGVLRIDVRVRAPDARPASGKPKLGATQWTVTVSGVSGDAVLSPNGVDPDWSGEFFPNENPRKPDDDDSTEPPPPGQPAPKPGPNPRTT